MFRYQQINSGKNVTVFIENVAVSVPEQSSVAAAMLFHAIGATRFTPVSDSPRAPFCMMGECFECLMIIDGQSNRQACMVQVRDGMQIQRQHGAGLSVV